MIPQKTQAIEAALVGDWQKAASLNEQMLSENPDDIDTLNRLAFAMSSLGNIKEAKSYYQKVLSLDTKNPIATKNLKRLSGMSGKIAGTPVQAQKMNNIFIEEPGKTKVIELLNVADQKLLIPLLSGEHLELSVKRMKIFVLDNQKQYIGMLPDDLSRRLISFMEGGNKYEAYVKTVDNHKLTVFLKETERAKQFKHQQSFLTTEKTKLNFEGKDRSTEEDDDDKDETHEEGGKQFSSYLEE